MEILVIAGALLSSSPFVLIALVIFRQYQKKQQYQKYNWSNNTETTNLKDSVVEIPQVPHMWDYQRLPQKVFIQQTQQSEDETPHHLNVGKQYNLNDAALTSQETQVSEDPSE